MDKGKRRMTRKATFLTDRGLLALEGAECRGFLQGLISNDVGKVTESSSIYAALLTAQGKFLHDFFVLQWGDGLMIDCEKERRGDLLRRLSLYKLRSKVTIRDVSDQFNVAVIFGEDSGLIPDLPTAPGATKKIGDITVLADPRCKALGYRAVGTEERLTAFAVTLDALVASAEDYHRLRISLGLPDGSRDLPVEKTFLLENNFEEMNGVDFNKGCYVGQELTARTKYRALVRNRLYRVDSDGPLPAPGCAVMRGEKNVGTFYNGIDRSGLALLKIEDVEEAEKTGTPLMAGDTILHPVLPKESLQT